MPAASQSYWQNYGTVGGGVHITQIRPTLVWDVAYNGGVSLSALTLPDTSSLHNAESERARQYPVAICQALAVGGEGSATFTRTTRSSPYLTEDRVPTFNDPNPVIYIPQAVTETNVGSVALTYQMTQHDSLSFTGGESFQRYINSALSANDSYSYSAGANYQHLFSARLSAGGGYSFTAIDYGHGLSRSGIQGITGFASYQLTPTMYVTGFVGPEYTASKDIVPTFCFPGFGCFGYHAVHQAEWSLGEGATFGWSGTRDAVAPRIQASSFKWRRFHWYGRALPGNGRLSADTDAALEFLCRLFVQQQQVDNAV